MNSIIYLLVLMICLFLLLIQSFLVKKSRIFILSIILLILALLSGTRSGIGGSDVFIYTTAYAAVPKLDEFFINFNHLHSLYQTYGFEKGYLFLTSFFKTLGFNYYGFSLIHAVFFFFALFIFIKKNAISYSIMIYVFAYKLYFYNNFISMRQSITLAIFLLAIEFIKNKSPYKYFFTIVLASTIHSAALVLLPLYFINKIDFTREKIVLLNIIFVPTLILAVLKIPILPFFVKLVSWIPNTTVLNKINNYTTNGLGEGLSILHFMEYFGLMLIILIFYNKIINIQPNANLFIGLFLCLLPIYTILSGYDIITRFKDYFVISYGIILGAICFGLGKYNFIFKNLILVICLLGIIRYMINFDNGHFWDYKSIILETVGIFN